ncbi:MAG: hypothetical protein M9924_12590 [Rhizobiaceae bacterium]|nr:hypothetical protein [Rhizobiaceae bacterium]
MSGGKSFRSNPCAFSETGSLQTANSTRHLAVSHGFTVPLQPRDGMCLFFRRSDDFFTILALAGFQGPLESPENRA